MSSWKCPASRQPVCSAMDAVQDEVVREHLELEEDFERR